MAILSSIRRRKVAVLVSTAALAALPVSAASAQSGSSSSGTSNNSSGSTLSATQGGGQGASADHGSGIQQNQQNAACQAGGNCTIDQRSEQNQTINNNVGRTVVERRGVGVTSRGVGVTSRGVGVRTVGVSPVRHVRLAFTGADAWILALVGGGALAGGLGLVAMRRRGGLAGLIPFRG